MKIKRAIATLTTVIGLLVVIGSVGGCDTGLISFVQAILQTILGLALTIGGAAYGVYVQEHIK